MHGVTTEEGSSLSVVGPHLEQRLFKRPRSQRVQNGVQCAVDGQNKDNNPRTDGSCIKYKKRRKIMDLWSFNRFVFEISPLELTINYVQEKEGRGTRFVSTCDF